VSFGLHERPADWAASAPVRLDYRLTLNGQPEQVFDVLADHDRWPTWFDGMRRTRVDGPLTTLGTLRTVWVGAARVQEHFVVWDRPRRLTLYVVQSNVPGMRVMAEDWQLVPVDGRTILSVTVGVDPAGPHDGRAVHPGRSRPDQGVRMKGSGPTRNRPWPMLVTAYQVNPGRRPG